MATTTWIARSPRTFAFMNGEVVTPLIEQTSTGRKVRIDGGTSFYSADEDKATRAWLDAEAAKQGTTYWMAPQMPQVRPSGTTTPAEFNPGETQPARAWWTFRHPTMPIEATLKLYVQKSAGVFRVESQLIFPDTRLKAEIKNSIFNEDKPHFRSIWNQVSSTYDDQFTDWVKRTGDGWVEVMTPSEHPSERLAIVELRKRILAMEERETISIPELRRFKAGAEPDKEYGWLDLRIHESGVNGAFLSDINEYLSEGGNVDRARGIYLDLVQAFRDLGMVMEADVKDSAFMKALLSGDSEALTISIGTGLFDSINHDAKHKVSLHLPTGTIVVDCEHTTPDRDETALHWEESLFRAQMTGKQDELLAYASAYAEQKHHITTQKIIDTRTNDLNL